MSGRAGGKTEWRKGAGRAGAPSFRRSVVPSLRRLQPFLLLSLTVACSDGRIPLLVYSPHGRDLLQLAEATFETANPGVDVRWLDMGSQDALDRIRSERANPQADVWFGGPSSLFARAAAESLLVAYRPSWSNAIPERGRGKGDYYFAVYETPAVIAYNSEVLSRDSVPLDWDDVLSQRWQGEVLIRDPLASGTMRAIFGMVIQRGMAEGGDTAMGFDWLRKLDAQTKEYVFNPALLHQKLLRAEGLLTLWDLPDILVEQNKGRPFDFILPRSGVPVIQDAIAIVAGTDNFVTASQFVEWAGSVSSQLMAAHEVFRLPARSDLDLDSLPGWVRRVRAEMRVEPMDWDLLAEHGAAWMRYWDRNIRGRRVEIADR